MSQQPLFVPASDGWYARPGDPPNVTRHWDGKTWQCEIRGPIKDHFNHLRSMQPEQRSPEDQDLLKQLTRDVSTIEDLVLGNPSDNPPLVPIQAPPPYIPPPTASYAPPQPMYAGPPPTMMPPQAAPMPQMYQAQPAMNAGQPQMYQGQPPMMPPRGPVQPPMMPVQPGPMQPPRMSPSPAQAPVMPAQPVQAQPPVMPPQPAQVQPTMAPPAPVMPLATSPEPASVQTPVSAPAPSMTPQWPAAVQPPAMAAQPASAQSPMMPPPSAASATAMVPQPVPQPAPVQPMMMAPPMPQPGPVQPSVSMPQPPASPYGMQPYVPDAPEFAAPAPKRRSRKALLVAIPLVVVLALAGIGYAFRSKLPFVSSTAALSVSSCVTLSTPAGATEANTVTWSASECTTAAAGPVSYVVVSKLPGAAQCDPDSQYVQTLSGSTVEYTYCLMENLTEGQCVYEDGKGLMFDVPCSDTRALVKVGVRAEQGTGYSCPAEMTAWRFPAGNRTYCLSKP